MFEIKMANYYYGSLYKYADMKTAKLIIENQTLKFSKPTEYNDPLDCYEGLITVGDKLQFAYDVVKAKYSDRNWQEQIKMIAFTYSRLQNHEGIEDMFKKQRDKILMSCFSKKPDELLMWSYYSEGHKGLCFQFDFENKIQIENEARLLPIEVEYKNKLEQIGFTEDPEIILHWIATKSIKWEHEDEVRLATMDVETEDRFRLVKFPQNILKKVIFGFNLNKDDREQIMVLVENTFTETSVEFSEIIIDHENFYIKEVPYIP